MTEGKQPVTIKKYANRRLYDTGSSSYVTLEDLAGMVKRGEDFTVCDAKSGDDLTRSVLTQIIFEQEAKDGQSLLPVSFLRQLIGFYGDGMQMLVPSYLQYSIDKLSADQQNLRDQMKGLMGGEPHKLIGAMEEQAKKNMAMFSHALTMFNPFAGIAGQGGVNEQGAAAQQTTPGRDAAPAMTATPVADSTSVELDNMKKQMADMQKMLEGLAKKG
ncbi:MAG: polyhydroxyalkanoate synthesis repressor PhaR [Beijerinckiaceae bacterium]|jgi:polyhydroxyalkanoate synthesis repressor PhaR|nr:polyhydroxyalkanoate synthesis repressor PhaR [Beijerinckiaceae bacterium]